LQSVHFEFDCVAFNSIQTFSGHVISICYACFSSHSSQQNNKGNNSSSHQFMSKSLTINSMYNSKNIKNYDNIINPTWLSENVIVRPRIQCANQTDFYRKVDNLFLFFITSPVLGFNYLNIPSIFVKMVDKSKFVSLRNLLARQSVELWIFTQDQIFNKYVLQD